MTDTATNPLDAFVATPDSVLFTDARIDDVKAEKVYRLATTPAGVTNQKVYPGSDDADYKKDRRDLIKHVQSRTADTHKVVAKDWKPKDGSPGIGFTVFVVQKSNRGRKPNGEKAATAK